MKRFLFALALVSMMVIVPLAQAGMIDGVVMAEGGFKPLKYTGYVIAYWWDADKEQYVQFAYDEVGPDKVDFLLTDLPEGMYYLEIGGDGYITEYYNDTMNFDEKEEITLLEDDSYTCDPINLGRTPYQILDETISTDVVGTGGGMLKISANILNNTRLSVPLYFWPNVSTQGSPEYGTPNSVFAGSTPKKYTIKPNNKTYISFLMGVPSTAPNNTNYTVTLYGGASQWNPTVQESECGTFFKGNPELTVVKSGAGKFAPRTPLRVSPAGMVLEWK